MKHKLVRLVWTLPHSMLFLIGEHRKEPIRLYKPSGNLAIGDLPKDQAGIVGGNGGPLAV